MLHLQYISEFSKLQTIIKVSGSGKLALAWSSQLKHIQIMSERELYLHNAQGVK